MQQIPQLLQLLQSNQGISGLAGLTAGAKIAGGFSQRRQAEENADLLEKAGKARKQDILREGKELVSKQRVRFAAGGVQVNTGTPLDVQAATAATETERALRAQFGLDQRAFNERLAGSNILTDSFVSASQTLLGAGLSLAKTKKQTTSPVAANPTTRRP